MNAVFPSRSILIAQLSGVRGLVRWHSVDDPGQHEPRNELGLAPVGQVDEPHRTPLWLIRTLATALAEDQSSNEHRQHVARQIARTAEELELSLTQQ